MARILGRRYLKVPNWVLGIFITPHLLFALEKSEISKLESWPLSKILQQVIDNSPALKATLQESIAVENKAYQAGRWDNPEVSITYGKKTVSGNSGKTMQLSLLQNIPLFGQKAINEKLGLQELLITKTENELVYLAIKHEVIRRTYRLAALEEQLQHVSHRRDRIRLIEGFLKTRPFASPTQAVEKHLIENRLREIEERFVQVQASSDKEWEALNVFLGLKDPISPSVIWYKAPLLPDRIALSQKAQKDNLELNRQKSVIGAAEMEIEQAGKKRFPDIKLGGGYSEESADATEKSYFGTLQLSIPLLDAGTYGKEAARAKREAEGFRFEQKKRDVAGQFEQVWAELVESKSRVQIYPIELIAKLETEMQRTERDWKKGLIPVAVFLEMESQVHDQAAKVYDAQVSFVNSLSQALLLSGQGFKLEEKQ